jgi:hypothetical protein
VTMQAANRIEFSQGTAVRENASRWERAGQFSMIGLFIIALFGCAYYAQ